MYQKNPTSFPENIRTWRHITSDKLATLMIIFAIQLLYFKHTNVLVMENSLQDKINYTQIEKENTDAVDIHMIYLYLLLLLKSKYFLH